MRPSIDITRFGQHLAIEPVTDEIDGFISSFYTVKHEISGRVAEGDGLSKEYDPLIKPANDFAGDRVFKCPIGLQPLVEELLEQQSFRIRRHDLSNRNLKIKDLTELEEEFGSIDRAFLEVIRTEPRGLFSYKSGKVQPAKLIAQVAKLWPRLKIVVLVSRIAEAEKLKRQIKHHLASVECYHHRHSSDKRVKVAIATYAYAGGGPVGLTKCDIVFVPEPDKFLHSNSGRLCIDHAWEARMYAFQATGKTLAQYDRDQITACFGSQSLTIPAHGYICRPVDVTFMRIDGQRTSPSGAEDNLVDIKRRGIWQHEIRNRRFARLARALSSGDSQFLNKRFPLLDWDSRPLSMSRIVVLADGIDHAGKILRAMPGWSLVCAPDVWLDGIPAKDQQLLKERRKGWTKNRTVIATPTSLPRLRKIDVLVRMDAGIGLPPLSDHAQRSRTSDDRLLVIDANDRHHLQLRKWTHRRKQEYRQAGWNISGEEPESQLHQFLASRPPLEVV